MTAIPIRKSSTSVPLDQSGTVHSLALQKQTLKQLRPKVEAQSGSTQTSAASAKEQGKLKQACQDFESVFLNYMLSKMRDTVPKDSLFGSDNGEQIYRGMLDEQLSKQIAASGGVGIASMLYQQLGDPKK
jgi:flagellar protein FlgJ